MSNPEASSLALVLIAPGERIANMGTHFSILLKLLTGRHNARN